MPLLLNCNQIIDKKKISTQHELKKPHGVSTKICHGVLNTAFFNLLYVQSFGVLLWYMSAWSSERRLRTERDHNYFESLIQAISCHQFVEVFLSWSVCIIKSTLHTHLIWRQFWACRICTCMRRKTKHIQSASPCALEHCAFFNCIISVRLLSRAGYKLVSKVHSFEVWSQPVLLSWAPHQLISTTDLT